MYRYPPQRHRLVSSVAHYTSSISAYVFPRSDLFQILTSAGRTCTVKTTMSHGSIGCVPPDFTCSTLAYILTFSEKQKDGAHDMSLDRCRIIECPLPFHPPHALPPLPSTRPRRISARPLRLSANRPARAHESPAHARVGCVPCLLAVPTRHHTILFSRKQRIRRHACTRTRGVDAGRGGAYALLRVLARSCIFVDALECWELDHDGCGYGRRQLSGSHYHTPFSLLDHVIVKSVFSSRYVS